MMIFLAALQLKTTAPGVNPPPPLRPAVWQREAGGTVAGDTSLCLGPRWAKSFSGGWSISSLPLTLAKW